MKHPVNLLLESTGTVINPSFFSKYSLGAGRKRKRKQRDFIAKGHSRYQDIKVQETYFNNVRQLSSIYKHNSRTILGYKTKQLQSIFYWRQVLHKN